MHNVKKNPFGLMLVLLVGLVYLSSFTLITPEGLKVSGPDLPDAWKGYKSWTKITKEPNTGDPTGFLSKNLSST